MISIFIIKENPKSQGGGKITYTSERLFAKRLSDLETNLTEYNCLELTILKQKLCISSAYRPLQSKLFSVKFLRLLLLAGKLNVDLFDSNTHHISHLS